MKKVALAVLFWLSCGLIILGCGWDETSINKGRQVLSPPYPQITTESLYSIDKYDGYYSTDPYGFDYSEDFSSPIKTWQSEWGFHDTGFLTFDFSASQDLITSNGGVDYAKIKQMNITLQQLSASGTCPAGYERHEYIIPWRVPTADYQTWGDCQCNCYHPQDACQPTGCQVVKHYKIDQTIFRLENTGNDSYTLADSASFLNWFKKERSNYLWAYKDNPFLSFEVASQCDSPNGGEWGISVPPFYPWSVYYEDGGNHGKTNNLPTLEITY